MVKATWTMKGGAIVTIEGSDEEVSGLLTRLEGGNSCAAAVTGEDRGQRRKMAKPSPTGLISELIAEGFFSEPKDLGSIRSALREKGHFYPPTSLSPVVLRLVRNRELRRIKDQKRWTYVA
jgi:hypothetical protein